MVNGLTPEQMQKFTAFAEGLKPIKERFDRLSQDQRVTFVESVLGAYIQEAEKANGGDLQKACERTLKMADTLMKRAEGAPPINITVLVDTRP